MQIKVQGLAYIRDGESAENLSRVQIPETQCIGAADSETWLQDSNRLDKVRSQNELLLPIDTESVRRELLFKDVESAFHILGPFVNDVKVGISLDETTRRGTNSRAHVGDEKSTIGLCPNLIRNGCKDTAVTLQELGAVRVGGVEVEASILMKD